ncbi:hypothetical protein A3754_04605 [Alcanivorax sp. HI0083]|nr:hypothetical protein A3730_08155 [Alcanivorax sp. HI0044]KZZ30312.1 hypothetical protein A3754_04605 [Alcanivorax sp. HI0083]PHR64247.1 MAG: hypothetical protein COA55_14265 [Alcanivorax sp.]
MFPPVRIKLFEDTRRPLASPARIPQIGDEQQLTVNPLVFRRGLIGKGESARAGEQKRRAGRGHLALYRLYRERGGEAQKITSA